MDERVIHGQSVPVVVADVCRRVSADERGPQHVVILQEAGGERKLPIWIGATEASQIALRIQGRDVPRPSTYAFTAGLVQAMGGHVREVIITKLDEAEVYHAVAVVEGGNQEGQVDARPSDAINLALRLNAPMRVESSLFTAADVRHDLDAVYARDAQFAEGWETASDIVASFEAAWQGPGKILSHDP